jgi:hypothetical protein
MRGSGSVEVLHRRSGEEHKYSAMLDSGRVAGLADALADLRLSERQHRDVLVPDELTTTITLRRGDEVVYEAEVPGGERHGDEGFDAAMRRYEAVVAEATDGALPFGAGAAPS